MLRSSLCSYSDKYILVEEAITVAHQTAGGPNISNKKITFKNCAPFTNFISRINNMQLDDADDIDVVMQMYNLIEYTDNYPKHLDSYDKICRYEPVLNDNGAISILMQIILVVIHLKLKKNSWQNRQQFQERYWNNGTIKISKWLSNFCL